MMKLSENDKVDVRCGMLDVGCNVETLLIPISVKRH